MKYLLIFSILASLLLTACNGLFKSDDCKNCNEVACTRDFKSIRIAVKDANGAYVFLNDYKVTINEKENEHIIDQNGGLIPNDYTIATDGNMDDLKCNGTQVTFSYSLDGDSYNEETFLIGKDCCHIQWKDDKPQEIIID